MSSSAVPLELSSMVEFHFYLFIFHFHLSFSVSVSLWCPCVSSLCFIWITGENVFLNVSVYPPLKFNLFYTHITLTLNVPTKLIFTQYPFPSPHFLYWLFKHKKESFQQLLFSLTNVSIYIITFAIMSRI